MLLAMILARVIDSTWGKELSTAAPIPAAIRIG
jgi:hypothetical protein